MASKVRKKQLLQKDEIKPNELLENFKNTLNRWFLYGEVEDSILKEVLNYCVEIILHGLKSKSEKLQANTSINVLEYDSSPKSTASTNINNNNANSNTDLKLNEIHKIVDDFEWVANVVGTRRNTNNPLKNRMSLEEKSLYSKSQQHCFAPMHTQKNSTQQAAITSNVTHWLKHNLNVHNVCGFLQYLVADKELLEEHYNENALLRQKKYVSILDICLTAFETRQYGFLSQIKAILKDDNNEKKPHKRSSSQPNIIIINKPNPYVGYIEEAVTSTPQRHIKSILSTIRKTKSLPAIARKSLLQQYETNREFLKRDKCKINFPIKSTTHPQKIPQKNINLINSYIISTASHETNTSSNSFLCSSDDNQPSTSQASLNRTKQILANDKFNSIRSATPTSVSASLSSCSSTNTAKCIQLINTDDIKIWTDNSWEQKQKRKQKQQQLTVSCDIPVPLTPTAKSSKSLSPLNNFFSSLFGTPPSYTSWFIDYESKRELSTTETAIEFIVSDNNEYQNNHLVQTQLQPQPSSNSLSSKVFDTFLPTDGKKLVSRKSQNLFDNVNTPLDYSSVNMLTSAGNLSTESPATSFLADKIIVNSKNCQSLTRFLQMSHLSHNNTELEKENAHFRISEAIISAIEHIKWNKLETQKGETFETTPVATDYLACPHFTQSSVESTTTNDILEEDHVPYVELDEENYDFLSAEVVGLSLISKFDENHLPKVSELKWLVSDDDTPQKLLPMPDLTSSANPDDHIIHSATRGTRYWAPPRQQIIFTDHPTPNRKELLKKQNFRCTGCGMRVSPQYTQSFRFCTYLGKYHCTGCHRNQISATPAKILQAWDFKCYPVSVFAYRMLEQMYTYPLFYIPDLNPALYFRSKSLLRARNKRLQLKFVKDFINMCRFALHEQSYFKSVPDYITSDIDNWSMSDFIDVRTKCLHRSIDELIKKCENHIFNCVLCTARGFFCEYCHAEVVIYPWDTLVERCARCGTCFHRSCWKSVSQICCRCQRINKRQDEINDVI